MFGRDNEIKLQHTARFDLEGKIMNQPLSLSLSLSLENIVEQEKLGSRKGDPGLHVIPNFW